MKKTAIVLDDGPHETQREKWLALLNELQVKVTFACVGRQIEAYPDLARITAEAGIEQVNHTYSHAHCMELDAAALEQELVRTNALLEQTTGQASPWFWPPYGEYNAVCNEQTRAMGLENYRALPLSFISSQDWLLENSAELIFQKATMGITDRTVIICHEWRAETLEQFPRIVEELKAQGFELVTFSELADDITQ